MRIFINAGMIICNLLDFRWNQHPYLSNEINFLNTINEYKISNLIFYYTYIIYNSKCAYVDLDIFIEKYNDIRAHFLEM